MSNPSPSPAESIYILAAERTRRPDPLNSFRTYHGGWNFMNMSYLASAGFTGISGFVIGLLCLLLGLGIIVVMGCMLVCCKEHLKPTPNFDRVGNFTTLISLMFFTIVTITGCGVLFTGQEGLHSDLSTVFKYLISQFAAAVDASVTSVPPMAAPSAAQAAEKMESATNSISTEILAILDEIRLGLIILCAGMLVLALIGLVFVIYHIKPVIYTNNWMVAGHEHLDPMRVIGDTCVAMQEWADDPRPGSSFDMIMKCGSDLNSSSSHLSIGELLTVADGETQFPDYKFVNGIHQRYHETSVLENDDGHLNHIEKDKSIQEKPSTNDTCAVLRQSFVEIFQTVATNNCPGMRRNAKWVWMALVALSAGSTVSICLWILFTRRSTIRLRKVDLCSNQMSFGFEASNKKNDNIGAGASSTTTGEEFSVDVNGGGRRRTKPRQ
nr:uncharacterized protein LOC112273268 isoform X3 [Physcomitrium patens]|eukprot:XP_024357587.1 uncharacterized protein LOC112273268 isoform X3 [Physcomitrella patens]